MILADSSVWIDHLNKSDPIFFRLLQEAQVFVHPFVVGEIALGNLTNRSIQLSHMKLLPFADAATDDEVLAMIERHALFGSGIGYIDAHLLASARLSSLTLWTRDKRLRQVEASLGVAQFH